MVVLYQSQTLPVNPPGSEPVLSIPQFWEVMVLKCRKPELFITAVSGSEVLEETAELIKRTVIFKEVNRAAKNDTVSQLTRFQGMGPPAGNITEDISLQKPWKVFLPLYILFLHSEMMLMLLPCVQADFKNLDSGALIQNILSQGQNEKDLYLTFYFEWPYPDIQEGSDEEKETVDRLWGMAKETVQHTIDYARNMAKQGELKQS